MPWGERLAISELTFLWPNNFVTSKEISIKYGNK